MKVCEQCHLRYPNESTFCFVDGKPLVPLQDPRIGSTLAGRYLIEDVLGEGGMAIVYRARVKLTSRPCAVKVMNSALGKDKVVRERFRREAKAAQKLAHPNIIEIFDQGDTDDGTSFLVMEMLEGQQLADIIAEKPLLLVRAHDFGVIHRDLKPENIFISPRPDGSDLVKLLDFGIARSKQDSRLTGVGEVFGTPQYMAPERITSIDAGASSDLYALGIIFYEMLTGELPFEASDIPTWFIKHLKEPAPPLARKLPQIPPALDKLVVSLMAKDAKDRPVDAHRVHAELIAVAHAVGAKVPPDVDAEPQSVQSPAVSLRPVALDRWPRRLTLFEQMLERAYGAAKPAELLRLLEDVRRLVIQVANVRTRGVAEQRAFEAIEQRGKDGRQRFGFAVDALGVDASKARDEARLAKAAVDPVATQVAAIRAKFVEHHATVILWEGRSGFQEPYAELANAYRAAADGIEAWIAVRRAERAAQELAETKAREVVDLEFQIHELRAALAKLEQSVEAEHGEGEARLRALDKEAEALESQLLALATQFCTPLRKHVALAALFQELEADVAA